MRFNVEIVGRAQGLRDFAVKTGKGFKDRDVVVVESHLDFVVDRRAARANFVSLPKAGDFGQHKLLEDSEILLGDGNAIECLEKFADPAALEHHSAARSLSGVRGKNGNNEHTAQPFQRFRCPNANAAHFAERAFKRAALAAGLAVQAQGHATALAVICLRKIDELEVECKCACKQNSALGRDGVNQFQRCRAMVGSIFVAPVGLGIAAANGSLAQRFNVLKQVVAGLLAQHFAQQHAQRTHVAAQGCFFQVAGLSFKFGQPLRPAFRVPQKSHRNSIMHDGRRHAVPQRFRARMKIRT